MAKGTSKVPQRYLKSTHLLDRKQPERKLASFSVEKRFDQMKFISSLKSVKSVKLFREEKNEWKKWLITAICDEIDLFSLKYGNCAWCMWSKEEWGFEEKCAYMRVYMISQLVVCDFLVIKMLAANYNAHIHNSFCVSLCTSFSPEWVWLAVLPVLGRPVFTARLLPRTHALFILFGFHV